ncbi:MAG: hypothetical protein E7812_07815 [Phenylobacterium sp.]|nr:MAG: hypothetical protein E7812_07815 [Phenylobacterium sp.]
MKQRIADVLFWIAITWVVAVEAVGGWMMIEMLREHRTPIQESCWPIMPVFSWTGSYVALFPLLASTLLRPSGYRAVGFLILLALSPLEFIACDEVTERNAWLGHLAWPLAVVAAALGILEFTRRRLKARRTPA